MLTTTVSVAIAASPAAVWEALTTPEQIRQWFFGVETETDWTEGSPIVHRGEYQGRAYEDKGTVLRFEPERRLVHSHWSPVSGRPDTPENYQEVTWALAERDGTTELTVSETNLPDEQAKETTEQAWAGALDGLKRLLER